MKLRSRPGERRFALLHKGLAALGIVVAGEALLDQFPGTAARSRLLSSFTASPTIYLAVFTVSGALAAIVSAGRRSRRSRLRHDAIDDPHQARLLGVELARGVEDLLGEAGPTTSVSRFTRIAVAEPELAAGITQASNCPEQMRKSQQTASPSPPPMQ